MSFTQDELQAFNTILDQKLALQRQELERGFDQRYAGLKDEFEQRFATLQQETTQILIQQLTDQRSQLQQSFDQQYDTQQEDLLQAINDHQNQQQQSLEDLLERSLAAQLLAIEQLVKQHGQSGESVTAYVDDAHPEIEAIEVHTEVSWEDLVEVFEKVLHEQLALLSEAFQGMMKQTEQSLAVQMQQIRDLLQSRNAPAYTPVLTAGGEASGTTIINVQDIFTSIEQLERLIESMQVSMTANHAFLSNRLYHHQHLSLDRAHATATSSLNNNHHTHVAPADEQDQDA